MTTSKFADAGPCSRFTPVHGYMQQYDKQPTIDAWNVSCLGGWTAGNYVADVRDIAIFTKALYNLEGVVSNASRSVMTDWGSSKYGWYGAGTFNLAFSVGRRAGRGSCGFSPVSLEREALFLGDLSLSRVCQRLSTPSQESSSHSISRVGTRELVSRL